MEETPGEARDERPGEGKEVLPSDQGLGETSTRLDPKLAALLSYVLGWITGLLFFVIERNRYVRFHALQSILFNLALLVIGLAYSLVSLFLGVIPFLGAVIAFLLSVVIGVGGFVIWIMLMVRAYQGQWYKLPVIGDWADQNA